jgi:hypothetical protein
MYNIPNPVWATINRTVTCTPERGPPGGMFMSRPDVIMR